MQSQRKNPGSGPTMPGDLPIQGPEEGTQKLRVAENLGIVSDFEQAMHDAALATKEEEEEEEEEEGAEEGESEEEAEARKARKQRYICYCGHPSCTVGFREGRQQPNPNGIYDISGRRLADDE